MTRVLLPGQPLAEESCLRGQYRDPRRPRYLQVEGGRGAWHEGGRENGDQLRIEQGVFRPAPGAMRDVTGIQNYNFKIIRVGKVQYFLLVFSNTLSN